MSKLRCHRVLEAGSVVPCGDGGRIKVAPAIGCFHGWSQAGFVKERALVPAQTGSLLDHQGAPKTGEAQKLLSPSDPQVVIPFPCPLPLAVPWGPVSAILSCFPELLK